MTRSMLALVAGLLVTTSASSRETTIKLDGMCQQFTVRSQGHTFATGVDHNFSGTCATFLGEGRIAKLERSDGRIDGKVADISGIQDSNPEFGITTYDFQFPFVTGGKWVVYQTTDGRIMHFVFEGTYTILGGPASDGGSTKVVDLIRSKASH